MSQTLFPVSGGVTPQIQTTTATPRLTVLSQQAIEVKNLHPRPTEWVPKGRPIYRRLPATSETYQINFFNLVAESNILGSTYTAEGIEEVGYVYVPYGQSINGNQSAEVVASDSKKTLLVKGGSLIWKYGKTSVLPTIIDLEVLDLESGKYDLAYQLIYDDAPVPQTYLVENYSLSGFPLNITSSTDIVTGWRYPGVNAFLNNSVNFWSNQDTRLPTYAQPSESYLQWVAERGQSYKELVLRCPPGTSFEGLATLYYVQGSTLVEVDTVTIQSDSDSQFFKFTISESSMETGWKVVFSSLVMAIQSITVSGAITILESPSGPSPKAALVMYPAGSLPRTTENTQGEQVPASYCTLAEVNVDPSFNVGRIVDTRSIIHRDYAPVADWLTTPFDENLIDLYEQVSGYASLWMTPYRCMKQEYPRLTSYQITVEA